jgi:hypothetical protein
VSQPRLRGGGLRWPTEALPVRDPTSVLADTPVRVSWYRPWWDPVSYQCSPCSDDMCLLWLRLIGAVLCYSVLPGPPTPFPPPWSWPWSTPVTPIFTLLVLPSQDQYQSIPTSVQYPYQIPCRGRNTNIAL